MDLGIQVNRKLSSHTQCQAAATEAMKILGNIRAIKANKKQHFLNMGYSFCDITLEEFKGVQLDRENELEVHFQCVQLFL